MKFRWHRGGLAESMATVVKFDGSKPALIVLLNADPTFARSALPISADDVAVAPYGFDDRIGWDTHLVTVGGNAIGFTDGMI